MEVAAVTARLVRRISFSRTPPKVNSAQRPGSSTSCVFICSFYQIIFVICGYKSELKHGGF